MFRGQPEYVFQVERVELGDEEHEDDPDDGQPTLQRRQRVPRELDPTVRSVGKQEDQEMII